MHMTPTPSTCSSRATDSTQQLPSVGAAVIHTKCSPSHTSAVFHINALIRHVSNTLIFVLADDGV